jgi:hypothetical protein
METEITLIFFLGTKTCLKLFFEMDNNEQQMYVLTYFRKVDEFFIFHLELLIQCRQFHLIKTEICCIYF